MQEAALSKTDLDGCLKRQHHFFRQISSQGSLHRKTMKSIIEGLIESTQPLILAHKINDCTELKDMASWLWNKCMEYNDGDEICSRSFFFSLFNDTQKTERKHLSSAQTILVHDHEFISDGKGGKICPCRARVINEEIFIPEQRKPEAVKEKKQTKKTKDLPEGIVMEAFDATLEYLSLFQDFITTFKEHCSSRDGVILSDFERSLSMKEMVNMCMSLKNLYAPVSKMYSAKDSIMGQMNEEINIKAVTTPFQEAMCKLLMTHASWRQWAHRFGISPRQFQRVRARLATWPKKDAAAVIEKISGSISCPECDYNLLENKPGKMKDGKIVIPKTDEKGKPVPVKLALHSKYPRLNTIERVEAVFSGKIKPSDLK